MSDNIQDLLDKSISGFIKYLELVTKGINDVIIASLITFQKVNLCTVYKKYSKQTTDAQALDQLENNDEYLDMINQSEKWRITYSTLIHFWEIYNQYICNIADEYELLLSKSETSDTARAVVVNLTERNSNFTEYLIAQLVKLQ